MRYRPGKVNKNADAMSRLPVNYVGVAPDPESGEEEDRQAEEERASLSVPNIKRAQQKDAWCQGMLEYLRRKVFPIRDDTFAKQIVLSSPQYLVRGDGLLVTLPITKGTKGISHDIQPVIVLPP